MSDGSTHNVDLSHLAPTSAPAPEASSEGQYEQATEATDLNGQPIAQEDAGMGAGEIAEGSSEGAGEVEAGASVEDSEAKRAEEEAARKLEEDKQKWDSRFTALSKKEKSILNRERQLKEMQDKVAAYEESLAKAKENPMSILEQAGLSFEDLVNHAIGAEAEPKQDDPDSKYKSLEEKLANMEQELQRKEQEREERIAQNEINEFKSEIVHTLEENNDRFEIINALGEQDMVFNVIQQHYDSTEELLSIEQAADQVEKYLEDTAKSLLKLKKFNNTGVQANVEVEQTVNEQPTVEVQAKPSSKTLTNKANVSTTPAQNYGLADREKSISRSAKLIEQMWKN